MRNRSLLTLLFVTYTLFATGARADCNRPSTEYERQDCAFKADRDFRRGNTPVDQATRSYLDNLRRSTEQEEEDRRQAKQQQEAAESQRLQQEEVRRRGEEADRKEREFQRQYGTPRQREQAYIDARESFNAAMRLEKEGQHKLAEELYRRAEKSMAIAAIDHPHDYPLVIESLGESLRKQGRYEEALPVLQSALNRRIGLTHEYHPMNGDVLISLGRTYDALGRYGDAEPLLLKALYIRQQQYGKSSLDAAYCHVYLGSLYANQKRLDKAQVHFGEAISIRTEQLGLAHPDTIRVMKQMATVYRDAGMQADGDKLDKRIQDAAKDPQYTSRPSVIVATPQAVADWKTAWNALSDEAVKLSVGRNASPASAVAKAREALALAEKSDGPKKLAVASSQDLLAQMLWRDKQTAEAETLLKTAIGTLEQSNESKTVPALAKSLTTLAKLQTYLKRPAEAEQIFQRVIALREKQAEPNVPALIESLGNLRELYDRQISRTPEYAPLLHRMLSLQEKQLGPDHLDVAETLQKLAFHLYIQGMNTRTVANYSESETYYNRARGILEKNTSERGKHLLVKVLYGLGEVYEATDRAREAEQVRSRHKALADELLSGAGSPLLLTPRRAGYRPDVLHGSSDQATT